MRRLYFLFALQLCCGASPSSQRPIYWDMGPAMEGRALHFNMRVLQQKYPTGYFFVDVQGALSWVRAYNGPMSDLEDGYYKCSTAIRALRVRRGSQLRVYMGIAKSPYSRGMDIANMHVFIQQTLIVQPDESLFLFEQDELRETSREIIAYNPDVQADRAFTFHDAYQPSGVVQYLSRPNRTFPLSTIFLEYINPYVEPLDDASAEIRFLDHVEDFESFTTDHGGYRSYPLSVTINHTDSSTYRYSFALERSLRYSAVDYHVISTLKENEPTFSYRGLLMPLRQGHDNDTYRFQIVIKSAGCAGDEVILSSALQSDRNAFGPCSSATYCIHST